MVSLSVSGTNVFFFFGLVGLCALLRLFFFLREDRAIGWLPIILASRIWRLVGGLCPGHHDICHLFV
jgi:hypothetical protein